MRCPTTEFFLCGGSSKTFLLASLSGERCSGGQLLSTFSDLAGGLLWLRCRIEYWWPLNRSLNVRAVSFFLCIIARSSSFFDDSLGFIIFMAFRFSSQVPTSCLSSLFPHVFPPSTYPLTSANFSAPKLYFVQPPFFPGPSGPHFYPRF